MASSITTTTTTTTIKDIQTTIRQETAMMVGLRHMMLPQDKNITTTITQEKLNGAKFIMKKKTHFY